MLKWQLVESLIIRHIAERGLAVGDELPSDREFANRAACSIQPVLRAMENMERKGYLRRRPGTSTVVFSKPMALGEEAFSFAHNVVAVHGQRLTNKLLEQAYRLPSQSDEMEKRAQQSLGLTRKQPFLVVTRLRYIEGQPRAIHRSFLNPAHLGPRFTVDHDLEKDSLVSAITSLGFRIQTRKTAIRARMASEDEAALLSLGNEPILEAEQESEAIRIADSALVVVEFMHACYANWTYVISNRD